jgi:hypothetical protein
MRRIVCLCPSVGSCSASVVLCEQSGSKCDDMESYPATNAVFGQYRPTIVPTSLEELDFLFT